MYVALLTVSLLTAFGAWADTRGFIWADRIWVDGRIVGNALVIAIAAYTAGMLAYVAALRYLSRLGEVGVTLQASGWYALTTIGVMVASGDAFGWSWTDRLLALLSIGSLTLLVARTS